MEKISKEHVEKIISRDARQPSFTYGLPYLLQSLRSDNLDNQKLVEIVARFPNIATRLLFVANSAWTAPRTPIESLDMACVRLGLTLVRSISVSICVYSTFNLKRCMAFDAKRYWSAALLVADGASWLASCPLKPTTLDEKSLHTAGLLHNIGLLWLAEKYPEVTSQALETNSADGDMSTVEALRATVGTDYCEVGGLLGRAWSLPPILVTVMEQHDNTAYAGPDSQSALLVGYAAKMVSALSKGIEVRPEISGKSCLTFNPSDLDAVYLKLAGKLDEYGELAQTLFPNS